MFGLYGNSIHDQARAHHLTVILPGDPEPVWLRHSAEISAILAERRTSMAHSATVERRTGLVARLRVALRLA